MKCDICDTKDNVIAGRWIFYCKKHKQNDIDKAYENEIEPMLNTGDFSSIDGELSEMMIDNL